MTRQDTSCARLGWHPDRGFELDVEHAEEGMIFRMSGVPVPADGTVELTEAPVELDTLEIMFKADIDLRGAPGQLREATVQAQALDDEAALLLRARLEDAESGEIRSLALEIPLEVRGDPPASGGPRPVPPSEDDLDWEDETTYERMFADSGQPPPSTEPAASAEAPSGSGSGSGFAALLQALASMDEEPGSEPPAPERRGFPSAPGVTPPTPDEAEPSPPDLARLDLLREKEARDLLVFLEERELLEFTSGRGAEDVAPGVAEVMRSRGSWEDKAERVSAVLLKHDAIEELFIGDEALAELLERW